MTTIISRNTIETKKLGGNLAATLKGGEVICLYGDLGAGKTVFVQGMMEYFSPGKRVLSPTFIIVRHYLINGQDIKKFLHIDLYRMSNAREIEGLEFFELMHKSDTVIAIEWAEKLQNLLPENRIDVRLETLSDQQRSIKIDRIHAIA